MTLHPKADRVTKKAEGLMESLGERGRQRVVIEGMSPEIDGGRFPVKRVMGDTVTVEADVFADGHDLVACRLLHRRAQDEAWVEVPMTALGNDRWAAQFVVETLGEYRYTVEGWVDHFLTWRYDLKKRIAAKQDLSVEVLIGANLAEKAATRATGPDAKKLREFAATLRETKSEAVRNAAALDEEIFALLQRYPDRRFATRYDLELAITVDRKKAEYSSWYEMFPRSCGASVEQHGTFADCEKRLPYIAGMGFDVLYLPPIHPIGDQFRKGKNNAVKALAGDVGSPWAIGHKDGGHKSILRELGTLADFERFAASAGRQGLEVALDIAFQCTPDHPYVREHPEWFRHRPDGTIQYAENPPKKYQDIYPIDFESDDWQALWEELRSIFLYWIGQGVKIFRVDNPHTKAFPFWAWVIPSIKQRHPDVIFLAEAFTRPKVMQRLAKVGFSQSYTYFTWRNSKKEFEEYFTELTATELQEYFRPNPWPNTPDILPEHLQVGGRPVFLMRLALAATLGASYGIYGPAYELCEGTPREPRSEEYLNSEKYEIRHWELDSEWSLKEFITRVNRIRRDNPALHSNRGLRFHQTDNPQLLCYSKSTDDGANVMVMVVNLDAFHTQAGWVTLDLESLGIPETENFQVHDLITDSRYVWHGPRSYVELNPHICPAHLLRVRKRVHSEEDFENFA